jgi:hypothetical protein
MKQFFLGMALVFTNVSLQAQVLGCTDPLANNYNSSATHNDGSCTYNNTVVVPFAPLVLSDTLQETSGLIWYNNYVWSHNDNTDTHLYGIDTGTGFIAKSIDVSNAANYDWEEISQDNDYVYVGDFGNNGNGNRQNLHLLRLKKSAFGNTTITSDTIWFHYEDQTNFTPTGSNNTDYDCEAFIVTDDSIYLFTKQWVSKKTSVYSLPKTPGNYAARLRTTYNVQGMITGANYQPSKKTIVLCGYNFTGSLFYPFFYLLYDFTGDNFFSGNKRRLDMNQPLLQMEGITTRDGKTFFISNEKITSSLITVTPKLQKINFEPYLSNWYQSLGINKLAFTADAVTVFPNPNNGRFSVKVFSTKTLSTEIKILDSNGKLVFEQKTKLNVGSNQFQIDVPNAMTGYYWLILSGNGASVKKKIVVEVK